ncbi:hypothetical protein [Spiroplasma endosymbiont of Crioceris asparagi]|uniref:hypothetical protein n=1 Tax=Spiroplasma endosymbiont of Crioceris asparagi TaxID=3066286 RepID=UPI0030D448D4
MSYKIEKLEFTKKQFKPKKIDFEIGNNQIKFVISEESLLLKNFYLALNGKNNIKSGVFKINGYDRVASSWTKRKIVSIKPNEIWRRFVTKEIYFYFSVLLDSKAFKKYKSNYYENKFEYLSYKQSKNNLTELRLKEKIDEKLRAFVNSVKEVETQMVKDFFDQRMEYNNKKIELEEFGFSNDLKNLLKEYFFMYEKLRQQALLKIFYQSLWDKIYTLVDMRNMCFCEYKNKKTFLRNKKEVLNKLAFKETFYIVKRQLSLIDIEVSRLKSKIKANNFILNNLTQQIISYVNKKTKKKIKKIDEICPWVVISENERKNFIEKQEKIIFQGLNDEMIIFRSKIVEWTHEYHEKVLNSELVYGIPANFENYKKMLQKKKENIYTQVQKDVERLTGKLRINFKNIFIKNNLYTSYVKIIQSFLFDRKNIILYKITKNMNENELLDLFKTLSNVLKTEKNKSIIIIDEVLNSISFTQDNIYQLNDHRTMQINLSDYLKENIVKIDKILGKQNKIAYRYEENNTIKIMGKTLNNSRNIKFKKKGFVYLNPLGIKDNKKNLESNYIKIKVKVLGVGEAGSNLYSGIDNQGHFISFQSNNKYKIDENVSLYFDFNSILKII